MNWINEIRDDIRTLPQSPKILRKFGLIVGAVFLAVSLLTIFKWSSAGAGIVSGGIGLLLCGLGVTVPMALKNFHKAWMSVAIILGSVVSRIILTILFFLVITPIAITAKMIGKKFVQGFRSTSTGSYWIKRDSKRAVDYEKMY